MKKLSGLITLLREFILAIVFGGSWLRAWFLSSGMISYKEEEGSCSSLLLWLLLGVRGDRTSGEGKGYQWRLLPCPVFCESVFPLNPHNKDFCKLSRVRSPWILLVLLQSKSLFRNHHSQLLQVCFRMGPTSNCLFWAFLLRNTSSYARSVLSDTIQNFSFLLLLFVRERQEGRRNSSASQRSCLGSTGTGRLNPEDTGFAEHFAHQDCLVGLKATPSLPPSWGSSIAGTSCCPVKFFLGDPRVFIVCGPGGQFWLQPAKSSYFSRWWGRSSSVFSPQNLVPISA